VTEKKMGADVPPLEGGKGLSSNGERGRGIRGNRGTGEDGVVEVKKMIDANLRLSAPSTKQANG